MLIITECVDATSFCEQQAVAPSCSKARHTGSRCEASTWAWVEGLADDTSAPYLPQLTGRTIRWFQISKDEDDTSPSEKKRVGATAGDVTDKSIKLFDTPALTTIGTRPV
jgi:hypothetical protein